MALGYTTDGAITYVAAARYTSRGRLDNSFDGNGKLTDHVRQGYTHYTSTAVQSDGKIVAAGYTWNGSNYDFALARYNTDGSLDNTFSANGKKLLTLVPAMIRPGQSRFKVMEKSYWQDLPMIISAWFATIQMAPWTIFDGDGIITTDFGSTDSATSIAIQSDGKILAGGTALARYNINGSLDLSFDGDGKLTTPFDASHPFTVRL